MVKVVSVAIKNQVPEYTSSGIDTPGQSDLGYMGRNEEIQPEQSKQQSEDRRKKIRRRKSVKDDDRSFWKEKKVEITFKFFKFIQIPFYLILRSQEVHWFEISF